MNITLLTFFMFLMYNNGDVYRNAEMQVNQLLSLSHEEIDTFASCNGKITSIVLKDSVLNKPGQIGTEYNYPIYKFEIEIIFYKNKNVAAIENKQIYLKRYEYMGVTTGMEIKTTIDSSNTFYFDQNQQLITRKQLMEIQQKICKGKEE